MADLISIHEKVIKSKLPDGYVTLLEYIEDDSVEPSNKVKLLNEITVETGLRYKDEFFEGQKKEYSKDYVLVQSDVFRISEKIKFYINDGYELHGPPLLDQLGHIIQAVVKY